AAPSDESPIDPEMVRLAVDRMGGAHAAVLKGYYFDGLKMHEVGERLGISESRVSQLHAEAVERMRDNSLMKLALCG
ncbi:sigma-70 family RNA polymerase sigma factor, partial [Paludisphaera soli]|uniref:sigma-70 family RNA polymerase sigma factor n=1 Tax=Paludisphaera soli TaxID=2712865 RepID=UPI0028F3F120